MQYNQDSSETNAVQDIDIVVLHVVDDNVDTLMYRDDPICCDLETVTPDGCELDTPTSRYSDPHWRQTRQLVS